MELLAEEGSKFDDCSSRKTRLRYRCFIPPKRGGGGPPPKKHICALTRCFGGPLPHVCFSAVGSLPPIVLYRGLGFPPPSVLFRRVRSLAHCRRFPSALAKNPNFGVQNSNLAITRRPEGLRSSRFQLSAYFCTLFLVRWVPRLKSFNLIDSYKCWGWF